MATAKTTTKDPRENTLPGALVHTEFTTPNAKTLVKFLETNFGWKFETIKSPGGDYHLFTDPSGSRGGISEPANGQAVGTYAYLAVEDINATHKKLQKAGATIVVPPMEVEGMGWFLQFQVKGGGPILACWQDTSMGK